MAVTRQMYFFTGGNVSAAKAGASRDFKYGVFLACGAEPCT